MENKKLFDLVKEALGDCERSDIVNAWNEICCEDDEIHSMSDFDDVCDDFNSLSPTDIIGFVKEEFNDFDFYNDYFYIDGGSYYATDDPYDKVDIDYLINAILDEEVEIDGIDLDELKKACGELRPFRSIEEFKQVIPIRIGEYLEFREKERPDVTAEVVLIETGVNVEGKCYVVLGRFSYEMQTLFDKFEYRTPNGWIPFGIVNETTDSANEE